MVSFEILDGAMGSELIRRGLTLPKHIWSADANINSPDIVQSIQQNDIIKSINIIGDSVSDPDVDKQLSEWNGILDTILI